MMKAFFDKFKSGQKTKINLDHRKWRKFSYERTPEQIGISPKENNRAFGVLIDSVEFDNFNAIL